MELKIDPEFKRLMAPYSESESQMIENIIRTYGCDTQIITWNGYVIDNMLHYDICRKEGICYVSVEGVGIKCRNDAISYICHHQLESRLLSPTHRIYLQGKLYLSAIAKARDEGRYAPDKRLEQSKYDIAKAVATEVGLKDQTLMKYAQFSAAIDRIASKDGWLADRILKEQVKISQTNTVELSSKGVSILHAISRKVMEEHLEKITYDDIRNEVSAIKNHQGVTSSRRHDPSEHKAMVREMPQYDPDSEISSLSLTIPSWVSSIDRKINNTAFTKVTLVARQTLSDQLYSLMASAKQALKQVEEIRNG